MTRVLHVSQPTEAGVANVVLSLASDQVSRGWEVALACPSSGPLMSQAQALGARTLGWEATRSPGPTVVDETRRLARLVATVDPDVIHLHSAKAGLAGRLAVRGRRPTLFQPHAWSFEAVTGMVRAGSLLWERVATRWTDLAICVSEAEAQLGQTARSLPTRHVVIANGVDTGSWRPRSRDAAKAQLGVAPGTAVVCVGRLSRQKGQDVLLAAWPAVRAIHPEATLHLVGDGPDRDTLEVMASPGVTFHGTGSAAHWLAAADLVVLPSRWEGMPLVLLEAMASGRAVVATDVNGVREALGPNHAMVPVDQPSALAAAVIASLQDSARRTQEEERNRTRAVDELDVHRSTAAVAAATEAVATSRASGRH